MENEAKQQTIPTCADESVPRAVASEAPSIKSFAKASLATARGTDKASLATARGTDSEVVRTGRTISDLGVWRGGMTPSKAVAAYWNDGTVPWVTPKDMGVPTISNTMDLISERALNESGLFLFNPGCVAVVFRSGVLKHTLPVAHAAVPFTVNQDIKVLQPGDDVDSRFAYHTLTALGPRIIKAAVKVGTTVESVDLATFLRVPVFLPGEEEQRRIAKILDTVDAAIRLTEALIAKHKQMKAGLLHHLLTRGIDKNGRLRDPHRHPEQFKQSPLGLIPKEWEVVSLGETLSLLYRYPTYYGIEYVEDGIPEIRGELIQDDGSFDSRKKFYRYVTEETARRFPKVRVIAGDFVMSVRGTVGKIARVSDDLSGAVITANLIRMQFAPSIVRNEWAHHFLRSRFFQNKLDFATSGTTIRTIQVPALSKICFARPGINEQLQIAERLDIQDRILEFEEHRRDKLLQLKRGLMRDLLTGRVRVNEQKLEAVAG